MENFDIWLSVNNEGDAAVSLDGADEAREALIENSGGAAVRTVKLSVMMTRPEVVEIDVTVPDEAGESQHVEAKAA